MAARRFAYDLENISEEAAADFAMVRLKKMFPKATQPVQYLVSRWGTDPNSLGCYSYDVVGKPSDICCRRKIRRMSVDPWSLISSSSSLENVGDHVTHPIRWEMVNKVISYMWWLIGFICVLFSYTNQGSAQAANLIRLELNTFGIAVAGLVRPV
ncbi:putative spermine oxidase [Helianthus annuus]|uniref:Spermine oxidase n=1 Tax=Helianthus annuus TaxID=4232 RepID=A0A9K3IDN7_HELAN|nr:putative spermine oxidase [Helianthus annuus]